MEPPTKYQNGKIYTLRSHTTDMIYIGSTCDTLSRRKSSHKLTKRNELSKLDDFYIELLEDFPCKSRDELNKREGEWIRLNIGNCVNKRIEGRTYKEYVEDNKEKMVEYRKQWRETNKETIVVKSNAYYEANKESIADKRRIRTGATKRLSVSEQ